MTDLSANDRDNNKRDTNAKYNIFIWHLEHYVNRHAPMKKVDKRKQKIMTKPWISDQILKKIKHRNKLFAKKKNNPDDANTRTHSRKVVKNGHFMDILKYPILKPWDANIIFLIRELMNWN